MFAAHAQALPACPTVAPDCVTVNGQQNCTLPKCTMTVRGKSCDAIPHISVQDCRVGPNGKRPNFCPPGFAADRNPVMVIQKSDPHCGQPTH
jgi:hypothetical protein